MGFNICQLQSYGRQLLSLLPSIPLSRAEHPSLSPCDSGMPSLNHVTQAVYRNQSIGHTTQQQLIRTFSWNVPPRPRVREDLLPFRSQAVCLGATTLPSVWGEHMQSNRAGPIREARRTHQATESKPASDPVCCIDTPNAYCFVSVTIKCVLLLGTKRTPSNALNLHQSG